MKTRRTWVLVVFGVLVLMVFIGIGAIIAVAAWFQQSFETEVATEQGARSEFDTVRHSFANRPPLLEIRNGKPAYAAGGENQVPGTSSPETLHVMVWDRDDERLVRFTVPFWLLRMKAGPIELSSYGSDLDESGVDLRVEDVERFGPGLILDHTEDAGDRILVWTK